MLIARFDGACEKNPGGYAACACLIRRGTVEIYRKSEYLGFGAGMTNNVAEYRGLLLILKWFNAHEPKERLRIIGDARLVIRRMTKNATKPPVGICASLAEDCLLAASWHRRWLSFEWQTREQNRECDAMCQLAITEEIASHRSVNAGREIGTDCSV